MSELDQRGLCFPVRLSNKENSGGREAELSLTAGFLHFLFFLEASDINKLVSAVKNVVDLWLRYEKQECF